MQEGGGNVCPPQGTPGQELSPFLFLSSLRLSSPPPCPFVLAEGAGSSPSRWRPCWRDNVWLRPSPPLLPCPFSLSPPCFRDQVVPKLVEALAGQRVAVVAGGWRHTMAITCAGVLYGWGWNRVSGGYKGARRGEGKGQALP